MLRARLPVGYVSHGFRHICLWTMRASHTVSLRPDRNSTATRRPDCVSCVQWILGQLCNNVWCLWKCIARMPHVCGRQCWGWSMDAVMARMSQQVAFVSYAVQCASLCSSTSRGVNQLQSTLEIMPGPSCMRDGILQLTGIC